MKPGEDGLLIVDLAQLDARDLNQGGGKAANLGELLRAGFPVPAGFVITTTAYDLVVKSNNLPLDIDKALDLGVTAVSAGFAQATIPPALEQAILEGYRRLGGGSARVLGLGRHIHSGEYITFNQLLIAVGKDKSSYTRSSWEKKGFPIKYKKTINMRYKVVYLEDFWKWAKKYRTIIDFSNFEENNLGEEPDWVKEQRKADFEASKYKNTPWTKSEDEQFKRYLNSYSYSYRDISIKLMRTEGALKRRMIDLNIKQRPLKAENHNTWSEEEVRILKEMYNKGYKSMVIAEYIDKSSLAINGKIERMVKEGKLPKRNI